MGGGGRHRDCLTSKEGTPEYLGTTPHRQSDVEIRGVLERLLGLEAQKCIQRTHCSDS